MVTEARDLSGGGACPERSRREETAALVPADNSSSDPFSAVATLLRRVEASAKEEPFSALLRERDPAACERLVLEEYAPVFNYLWWLSGSRETASDLTQETFACAWDALERLDDRSPVRPWLYGIASRMWKQHLRLRSPQAAGLDLGQEVRDPSPPPEECALAGWTRRRIHAAVRRLPESYRQVVALHYFQGMTHREVAAALGIGVGLVKWRVSRSLRKLEQILGFAEES